jgi:hypothetical protein
MSSDVSLAEWVSPIHTGEEESLRGVPPGCRVPAKRFSYLAHMALSPAQGPYVRRAAFSGRRNLGSPCGAMAAPPPTYLPGIQLVPAPRGAGRVASTRILTWRARRMLMLECKELCNQKAGSRGMARME